MRAKRKGDNERTEKRPDNEAVEGETMAKSKMMSSKSVPGVKGGDTGKMNTSPIPKGKGASVPGWGQSVSPANNFMKQTPGRSGTGVKK